MNKVVFAFLVVFTTALMGSSFAVGKWGMQYSTPLLLVALRFLIAGVLMIVIVKMLGRPQPKGNEWFKILMIGLTQTAGVYICRITYPSSWRVIHPDIYESVASSSPRNFSVKDKIHD